jgi:hypothetical protein
MQDHWFPGVPADVFISHSHADRDLAIGLAGWLEDSFGITSFIDSMIWGYSDHLLRQIDNDHCTNTKEGSYNYFLRNRSTSYVHMMLTIALTKMIDKTECFFFINTPNSITAERAISQSRTYSPWIYAEVEMARMVRKRPVEEYRDWTPAQIRLFSGQRKQLLKESLDIQLPLFLGHLESISARNMRQWKADHEANGMTYPLDQLYFNHPLKKEIL